MTTIADIEDLRRAARQRLPRALFSFIDSGAYEEISLRANRAAFDAIRLRSRALVDVQSRTTSVEMLGETAACPFAIAPTGLSGLLHGNGEIHAARAAEAAGIPYCLPIMSICTIEEVRAAVTKPFWFQLYVFRDRAFSRSVIERAKAAHCPVLMITVDMPVRSQSHSDVRLGLTVPPRLTFGNAWDIATKPSWVFSVLSGKRRSFGNIESYLKKRAGILGAGSWANDNYDPTLSWRDIDWLRGLWPGKLVLKGLLDADDARTAAAAGVDGIVVSNHGGRQLDGAPAAIDVLPEIVRAVDARIEVLFDSGIRSGQDVLKALALGARGCLIGRAHLYGLAANGAAGVTQALDIIRKELDVSMALTGVTDIRDVTGDIVYRPAASNQA